MRLGAYLQSALPEQAAKTLVPDSCPVESIARLPSTPAMSDAVHWRNSFDARPVIPAHAWDASHVDPCSVRNRRFVYAQFIRNLRLVQTRLLQDRNLVSLLTGELLVVLHLCSFYLVV